MSRRASALTVQLSSVTYEAPQAILNTAARFNNCIYRRSNVVDGRDWSEMSRSSKARAESACSPKAATGPAGLLVRVLPSEHQSILYHDRCHSVHELVLASRSGSTRQRKRLDISRNDHFAAVRLGAIVLGHGWVETGDTSRRPQATGVMQVIGGRTTDVRRSLV